MLFSYCHLRGFLVLFSTFYLLFLLLIHLYLLFPDEVTKPIYKEGPNHEQQQQLILRRLHTQLMAPPRCLRVALEADGGASQRPPPSSPLHQLPSQYKEAHKYLLQSVFWSLPAFV